MFVQPQASVRRGAGWFAGASAFALALSGWSVSPAEAQQRFGTTVQLPTISLSTVSTSVMVPDRGYTSVGGISRMSQGRTRLGPALPPFYSRGSGSSASATRYGITTTIMDLSELDAEVLAQAPARRGDSVADASPRPAAGDALSRQAEQTSADVARDTEVSSDRMSVAEIRRRRQRLAAATIEEGQRLLEQADTAAAEGNVTLARAQYRLAAAKLTGSQRQEAIAKLRALVSTR